MKKNNVGSAIKFVLDDGSLVGALFGNDGSIEIKYGNIKIIVRPSHHQEFKLSDLKLIFYSLLENENNKTKVVGYDDDEDN